MQLIKLTAPDGSTVRINPAYVIAVVDFIDDKTKTPILGQCCVILYGLGLQGVKGNPDEVLAKINAAGTAAPAPTFKLTPKDN